MLVKLMRDYRMREMFKPSMSELGLCMYQLEVLVQEHLPDLYAHFQSQSIHTNLYASSWFLTLFTTVVPISLACRYVHVTEGHFAPNVWLLHFLHRFFLHGHRVTFRPFQDNGLFSGRRTGSYLSAGPGPPQAGKECPAPAGHGRCH